MGTEQQAERVSTLRGKEVVFTGDFRHLLDLNRSELADLVRRHGGTPARDIRRSTDILVRGESPLWKYGDYGERESEVAALQEAGYAIVIIDWLGFDALMHGQSARVVKPHMPSSPD